MKTIANLINPKTRGRNTICLNMVVHDETDQTINVIDTVAPYVDQMVIVQDGLNYPAIRRACEKHDGTYISAPYSGGWPELHRRLALAMTYTDWVFVIDSDEMPTEKLLMELRRLVNTNLWAYKINWRQYNNGVFVFENSATRLFRLLPELTWSMVGHSGPTQLSYIRTIAPNEQLDIHHHHNTDDDELRTDRNVYFVEQMMQRWGYIPAVCLHAKAIAKGNPKAEKEFLRCVTSKT